MKPCQFSMKKSLLAMLAIAPMLATGAAQAGIGFGITTNPNYPNGMPTYYANSEFPSVTTNPLTGATTVSGGLRKFVDTLAPLGCSIPNDLGQCIPIAVPDTTTYPGSDYYEIGIVEYTEKMHHDLPKATKLRGYVQLVPGTTTYMTQPHYLGPVIIAQKDRPVRIKYTNLLPTGAAGDLFLPVDDTLMGAGSGPNRVQIGTKTLTLAAPDPVTGATTVNVPVYEEYKQNRTVIHLHGGDTAWISDGTPHQWTVPAGETTSYPRGASFQTVPDMPDPGPGSGTLYWTNHQSARLMFYHDHASGITRLNVYAGEAAGYLLTDPVEQNLATTGVIPGDQVPLVIQDKTFVPSDIALQDAKWDTTHWGAPGDLWFPHVYETNQDPLSLDGTNPVGRWDWGPWFWPVFPATYALPSGVYGDASSTPEAFMDTPVINGTAYPTLTVDPKAYRFRILDAANDRFVNLGLYLAEPLSIALLNAGTGYTNPVVTITAAAGDPGTGATATATLSAFSGIRITAPGSGYTSPQVAISAPNVAGGIQATATATFDALTGAITSITLTNPGSGYTTPPTITITDGTGPGTGATAVATSALTGITVTNPGSGYVAAPLISITDPTGTGATAVASVNSEVKMVPFDNTRIFPTSGGLLGTGWGTPDNRAGGVPDPTTAGPEIIQIGSEGGLLPAPVEIPSTPINYEYNKRSVTVLNVLEHGLYLGPAERADAIIDFSGYAGKTLILYNDAPAPVPASDPRIDYYTGDADQTAVGGAPTTLPGYGPNTRTIMQIKVNAGPIAPAFNLAALQTQLPSAYASTQPKPVIPESGYNGAFGTNWTNTYARIYTGATYLNRYQALSFTTPEDITYKAATPLTTTAPTSTSFAAAGTPISAWVENKAIQELFEPNYGRMNATLGVELPFSSALTQTTIPLGYIDPATETIANGETQFWKITHNGVDTHPVHFHLLNVQVINRVGWDGTIKPPAANELGWKETVKMNPLEDIIVAVRAKAPALPFGVPLSSRPLDPTQPLGSTMGFTQVNPATGNPASVSNITADFGWEYVWHCHILGHEENDFMRPFVFKYTSVTPDAAVLNSVSAAGVLNWTDPTPATLDPVTGQPQNLGNPKNEIGFAIERAMNGGAFATVGHALANATSWTDTSLAPNTDYVYRVMTFNAAGATASNTQTLVQVPPAPTGLAYTLSANPLAVNLSWQDTANETGYQVLRNGVVIATLAANVTSYVDTAVAMNATYSYQVVAFNTAGNSTPSAALSVTMPTLILAAPSNLTASYQPFTVTLGWGDASIGETGYVVKRATVTVNSTTGALSAGAYVNLPTPTSVLAPNLSSYVNANVSPNTLYSYQVGAVNGATAGPVSSVYAVSATSVFAPTIFVANRTTSSLQLRWSSSPLSFVTGYELQRCQGTLAACGAASPNWSTLVSLNGRNTTSYTNTGLPRLTTYQYRIRALVSPIPAMTSNWSNTSGGTTL